MFIVCLGVWIGFNQFSILWVLRYCIELIVIPFMLTKSQGSSIEVVILEGEGIGSSAHEQAWHVQRCMAKHDNVARWGWGGGV